MTNHYLKAIDILRENLPDTSRELDQHTEAHNTGTRGDGDAERGPRLCRWSF